MAQKTYTIKLIEEDRTFTGFRMTAFGEFIGMVDGREVCFPGGIVENFFEENSV